MYVGNLTYEMTKDDLREVFAKAGEVGDVSIVTEVDGRSRGFGFVTMMEKEDTDAALALSGMKVMGRSMHVNLPKIYKRFGS